MATDRGPDDRIVPGDVGSLARAIQRALTREHTPEEIAAKAKRWDEMHPALSKGTRGQFKRLRAPKSTLPRPTRPR